MEHSTSRGAHHCASLVLIVSDHGLIALLPCLEAMSVGLLGHMSETDAHTAVERPEFGDYAKSRAWLPHRHRPWRDRHDRSCAR